MKDEVLFARYQNGDDNAFHDLYQRYVVRVQRLLQAHGAAPDIAEDLTQEAFMQAALRKETFDSARGCFRNWLFRIACNRLADFRRRRSLLETVGTDEDAPSPLASVPDPGPSPSEHADLTERAQRLRDCIAALPPDQRGVMYLRLEGLQRAEIAEVLGIPVGTVDSRLYHARQQLRECMQDD